MAAGMAGKACPPPPRHAAHATAAPRDPLPPKPCCCCSPGPLAAGAWQCGALASAPFRHTALCATSILPSCTLERGAPLLGPPWHGGPRSVHHGGTVAPILVMFPFVTPILHPSTSAHRHPLCSSHLSPRCPAYPLPHPTRPPYRPHSHSLTMFPPALAPSPCPRCRLSS